MGEKQEKVFVVIRWESPTPANDYTSGPDKPVKVFDDRKDARAYCKRYNASSRKWGYTYVGVKKG